MFYDKYQTHKWYNTIQDYYNSPLLDEDLIYDYLAQGKRQPQNELEKQWKKEGQELLKQGGYDMSFN